MVERRNKDRRNKQQDQLLTDEQVALMAAVPINTVCYWRLAGVLPFVKVGRHPRIWLSDFQRTFHQPKLNGSWEPLGESVKIPPASDIRRKL
jgi:hypothetical protein